MVEQTRPDERLPDGPRQAVLFANYCSSFAIGLAVGGVIPFLTLVLEGRGVEEIIVGANTASASAGIILLAPFVPRIVRRFGLAASVSGGLAISVIALLSLGFLDSLWAWFLLRPVVAAGTAIQWIASETWMNAVCTARDRGRIMAIYVTAIAAGFAVGPALLAFIGVDGWLPFIVFGGSMLLSALPLVLVSRFAPALRRGDIATPLFLLRRAPTLFAAMVAVGLYGGGCMTFLPIYGLRSGLEQADAVFVLTAFLAGNMLFQIPVGWLADRYNPRLLLLACAAIAAIAPFLVTLALTGPGASVGVATVVLLAVWGGAVFAFYTIGLTMLGARFRGGELAIANAAFVMTFECANIAGPVFTGAALWVWSPHGMMLLLVAIALLFAGVTLFRGLVRE